MTSQTFDNELNNIFVQNQSKRLYNDQFTLFIDRLKEEYTLLNAQKMNLYRTSSDPSSCSELKRVEKRISENRAEIMTLYKTTVMTLIFFNFRFTVKLLLKVSMI